MLNLNRNYCVYYRNTSRLACVETIHGFFSGRKHDAVYVMTVQRSWASPPCTFLATKERESVPRQRSQQQDPRAGAGCRGRAPADRSAPAAKCIMVVDPKAKPGHALLICTLGALSMQVINKVIQHLLGSCTLTIRVGALYCASGHKNSRHSHS